MLKIVNAVFDHPLKRSGVMIGIRKKGMMAQKELHSHKRPVAFFEEKMTLSKKQTILIKFAPSLQQTFQ